MSQCPAVEAMASGLCQFLTVEPRQSVNSEPGVLKLGVCRIIEKVKCMHVYSRHLTYALCMQ